MSANLMSLASSGGKFLKLFGDRKMMKRLPYDSEVEYLESTGTQWIDTPITFQVTDEVYFKGALIELSNDKFVLSAQPWNNNNNRFSPLGFYDRALICAFGKLSTPSTMFRPFIKDSEPHTITYKNKVFTMEDTGSIFDGSGVPFGGETGKIKFFYGYNAPSKSRIYYYKQLRNGELLCDFIPVLDREMRPAMYDRVSGQFFRNAGTGAFIIGPDKTI